MAIVQLTYFRLSFISKIVHEVQCTFIKEASEYTFTDTVVSFSLMLSHGQAHSLYGQAVIMACLLHKWRCFISAVAHCIFCGA